MTFDFNLYSTPLLFGFVQGWVYAVLFWVRAWRQERLSDGVFGCLLAALTFEIWEYMLGFGGVEILWNELEFFPRHFGLLLPPLAYLYLKSQFNAGFRLTRAEFRHAVPFLVYVVYHIAIFAQGAAFVEDWKEQVHIPRAFIIGKYWVFLPCRSFIFTGHTGSTASTSPGRLLSFRIRKR
jgi:hypothetical protein